MTTAGLGAGRGLLSAQTVQNAPSALGLAATGQHKRFGKKNKDDNPLGMTMFFRVTVVDADLGTGGSRPLGDWSVCSGLSVKFNTEQLEEGGEYDSPWHMPTKITYGEVTLERAIDASNAGKIESWLKQIANTWMKGDKGGSKEVSNHSYSTTVDIELCSSALTKSGGKTNVVHRWSLQEAIPITYTGPTLSSKSNDVAIEKVVIAHRGFASISGKSNAKARTAEHSLTLTRTDKPDDGTVTFPYNPKTIGLSKTAQFKKEEVKQEKAEQAALDPGALVVTINNLRLEGVKAIQDNVDLLLKWVETIPPTRAPDKAPTAAQSAVKSAGADAPAAEPDEGTKSETASAGTAKTLKLSFGQGVSFTVMLKAVGINYTRFTSTGLASRADVNLTLQVNRDENNRTNPTSGGRPGRTIHTTAVGESLQTVATAVHGTPSAWREIAVANGIDDPMRIRPGRALHLEGPR